MSVRALESKVSDIYRGIQASAKGVSQFATRAIAKVDAGTLNADVMIRDTLQQLMSARDVLVDPSEWTQSYKAQLATFATGQGNNPSQYVDDYEDLRDAVVAAITAGSAALARDGSGNVLYLQISATGVRTEAALVSTTAFRAALVAIVTAAG